MKRFKKYSGFSRDFDYKVRAREDGLFDFRVCGKQSKCDVQSLDCLTSEELKKVCAFHKVTL